MQLISEMLLDLNNISVGMSIIGGTFLFVVQFSGLIWKLSRVEQAIHDRITEVEKTAEIERAQIRQRMLELELRISENYLKKDSFRLVTEKIDQHLIRLEAKLDAAFATGHKHG